MGAHPRALARLAERIRSNPAMTDQLLDLWLDYTQRATEWDAELWGFDPDRWMAVERVEMDRRAHSAEGTA